METTAQNNHTRQWCINIDIEGFSNKYNVDKDKSDKENKNSRCSVLGSFRTLIDGVYKIGTEVYGKSSVDHDDFANRLFAYQIGDGFQIISELNYNYIDRAVAIAISLMRHVLASGGIAKAGIAIGDFMDIKSCYPQNILAINKNDRVSLGSGIMTIAPVMGTAWIDSAKIATKASGSLLLISSECKNLLTHQFELKEVNEKVYSVNWLKSETDLVTNIMKNAGLTILSEQERINKLVEYINSPEQEGDLTCKWVQNTCDYQNADLELLAKVKVR